eukprot:186216-Chlamydomonas_euryale.AAC.1
MHPCSTPAGAPHLTPHLQRWPQQPVLRDHLVQAHVVVEELRLPRHHDDLGAGVSGGRQRLGPGRALHAALPTTFQICGRRYHQTEPYKPCQRGRAKCNACGGPAKGSNVEVRQRGPMWWSTAIGFRNLRRCLTACTLTTPYQTSYPPHTHTHPTGPHPPPNTNIHNTHTPHGPTHIPADSSRTPPGPPHIPADSAHTPPSRPPTHPDVPHRFTPTMSKRSRHTMPSGKKRSCLPLLRWSSSVCAIPESSSTKRSGAWVVGGGGGGGREFGR